MIFIRCDLELRFQNLPSLLTVYHLDGAIICRVVSLMDLILELEGSLDNVFNTYTVTEPIISPTQ